MSIPTRPLPRVRKEFTALDRCDACGAQAYVSVIVNNTSLMFCNHHYNRHADALKGYTKIESIVEGS